jgi:hypothetical protein
VATQAGIRLVSQPDAKRPERFMVHILENIPVCNARFEQCLSFHPFPFPFPFPLQE